LFAFRFSLLYIRSDDEDDEDDDKKSGGARFKKKKSRGLKKKKELKLDDVDNYVLIQDQYGGIPDRPGHDTVGGDGDTSGPTSTKRRDPDDYDEVGDLKRRLESHRAGREKDKRARVDTERDEEVRLSSSSAFSYSYS
jgi:hypothetical protein